MTELVLQRLPTHGRSTPGIWLQGETILAVALEDAESPHPYGLKVKGQTRIPAGRYRIGVVHGTPMEKRLRLRYRWHDRGLLAVENVPGFSLIRIHPVNDHDDTDGCLGVASRLTIRQDEDATVDQVEPGMRAVYEAVIGPAASGEAWVTVRDWPEHRPAS